MTNSNHKKKLRIMHYPQIPCKAFRVDVDNIYEAHKIMNILGNYDLFQLRENIKPDYCNAIVLEEWDRDEKQWCNWADDETGIDDIGEYMLYRKQEMGW